MKIALRSFAFLAAVFAAATAAHATSIFTFKGSFLRNVSPGYYLETFDALPQYTALPSPLFFSMNGFSYDANADGGFFNVGPLGTDVFLSALNASTVIHFDLTGGNITAIGGQFFATDFDGNIIPATVTVTLADGTTFSEAYSRRVPFVGFTSLSPIVSLDVSSVGAIPIFASVNDLITGSAVPKVPESGSSAFLLGVAIIGTFCCRGFCAQRA